MMSTTHHRRLGIPLPTLIYIPAVLAFTLFIGQRFDYTLHLHFADRPVFFSPADEREGRMIGRNDSHSFSAIRHHHHPTVIPCTCNKKTLRVTVFPIIFRWDLRLRPPHLYLRDIKPYNSPLERLERSPPKFYVHFNQFIVVFYTSFTLLRCPFHPGFRCCAALLFVGDVSAC